MIIRLDKYLADMQIGTRKEVKELIKKGRITVNNEKSVSSDTKIDTERDIIMMDSEIITYSEFEYYMLNKPAGVVSASNDPKNKTVINLIKSKRKDLFPVGRLDKDTEGLLLVTNDGELAFRSGASATITGNMLTTAACATIRTDRKLLEDMGRDVTPEYWKQK